MLTLKMGITAYCWEPVFLVGLSFYWVCIFFSALAHSCRQINSSWLRYVNDGHKYTDNIWWQGLYYMCSSLFQMRLLKRAKSRLSRTHTFLARFFWPHLKFICCLGGLPPTPTPTHTPAPVLWSKSCYQCYAK